MISTVFFYLLKLCNLKIDPWLVFTEHGCKEVHPYRMDFIVNAQAFSTVQIQAMQGCEMGRPNMTHSDCYKTILSREII